VEYSVKLSHFPATVSFPERVRERLRYDANRGELVYRGFMTKCSYDEISSLSDDPEYHRAVERLFVLTSAEVAPERASLSPPIMVAAAATVLMAAALVWGTVRHRAVQRTAHPPQASTVSTAR
jgi:hypothetical protein